MDERLARIGRLLAVSRGLEREGAYNGAKLVRAALDRELVRYAEAESPSGGDAAARALEMLLADGLVPAALAAPLAGVAARVRSGDTIPLGEAPRVHVCRVCGEVFLGESVPVACPVCGAPALSFREQLPVWYLEPADHGQVLAALATGPRHLEDALAEHDDEALARPPAPGEWSARETLEHLLYAEELFARRIERLLSEDGPDLAAAAVWAETPPSDEGTASTGDPASTLLARITGLRAATVARLRVLDDDAWARSGVHAEWGRVTVLGQAAYFARHAASHQAQLAAAARGRVPAGPDGATG
ncbi:MAG TPA: DinB family protein [Candidatus Limnocylindrales bacterium]|nr:DinB family protein [Candidatus Limnocylindrales bacterium]